jgi:hypothetical protein
LVVVTVTVVVVVVVVVTLVVETVTVVVDALVVDTVTVVVVVVVVVTLVVVTVVKVVVLVVVCVGPLVVVLVVDIVTVVVVVVVVVTLVVDIVTVVNVVVVVVVQYSKGQAVVVGAGVGAGWVWLLSRRPLAPEGAMPSCASASPDRRRVAGVAVASPVHAVGAVCGTIKFMGLWAGASIVPQLEWLVADTWVGMSSAPATKALRKTFIVQSCLSSLS